MGWQRDINHHSRFLEAALLRRAANRDRKGKIFLNGCRRFRNRDGNVRRRLAGMVIESKLRLRLVWCKPSPPRAISLKTLWEPPPPAGVLPHMMREDRASLGSIDPGRAGVLRIHCEVYLRGNIRGIFPGRRTD